MDLELKDRVVLVTGDAKGNGAAISRTLAAEAAIPVIVERDVEAANALHSQLACSELVIAELSSPESCYASIDHLHYHNVAHFAQPHHGLGMKPPQFLKAGDVVELGIEGLGESRQPVRYLFGAAALFALGLIAAHEHAH